MLDLGERRAAYGWEKVQGCGERYANLAKAAPALVMGNGLMQTLAFFESKRKDEHYRQLNQHLCEWLMARFQGQGRFAARSEPARLFGDVMQALAAAEPSLYRQATEEAMALLRWIRQFASAVTGNA